MNTISKTLAMAVLLTMALGACSKAPEEKSSTAEAPAAGASPAGTPARAASPASPTREPPLLEGKLEGLKTADGKDVDSVMYIADFPPGSVSAHHSHPGWEYNYIIKGAVTFEADGQEPFTRKAGEGMYNPRGNIHTVRNASQTEPAQLVSVLIKEAGAPVAVNV